jgi:hypothetical protein
VESNREDQDERQGGLSLQQDQVELTMKTKTNVKAGAGKADLVNG